MGISENHIQILLKQRIYRCVYYIRYLDSFLLGIRGSKFLAIDVKDETAQFIKCNLQLEIQLAVIHYAKFDKVRYLGFDIKIPDFRGEYTSKIKEIIAFKKLRNQLKQKKRILQSRGKTLAKRILGEKIVKDVSWIAKSKICCKKTIVQLVQRKNVSV